MIIQEKIKQTLFYKCKNLEITNGELVDGDIQPLLDLANEIEQTVRKDEREKMQSDIISVLNMLEGDARGRETIVNFIREFLTKGLAVGQTYFMSKDEGNGDSSMVEQQFPKLYM